MTTVSNLSDESARTFEIEAIVNPRQARLLRTSAYIVTVPFSSLSKTIHSICLRGGKVVKVTRVNNSIREVTDLPIPSGVLTPVAVQEDSADESGFLVSAEEDSADESGFLVPAKAQKGFTPSPAPKANSNQGNAKSRRQQSKSKKR